MPKVIIDVREPDEYARGHADGAINIPLSGIERTALLDKTSKDSEIVVYCNSGNRSAFAKNILEAKGFTSVTNGVNQQKAKELA